MWQSLVATKTFFSLDIIFLKTIKLQQYFYLNYANVLEEIPFKDFEKPLIKTIDKILATDIFSKSALVTFSKTKGGK